MFLEAAAAGFLVYGHDFRKPLVEVFTTNAKSDEPVSQGSMSLEQFVSFVQSVIYGSSPAHISASLLHSHVLDELNNNNNNNRS
uniref:Uncharacterized protein n=1 Tax=Caenorhabditis japonica TaxID=281687 RepID=A0A8R1EXF0_CAEJA